MSKNIHTVPKDGHWAVKQEGQKNPISQHRTKEAAQQVGASIARGLKVEHVIHGRDGKIQDKDSYGNDPHPPIDKKY